MGKGLSVTMQMIDSRLKERYVQDIMKMRRNICFKFYFKKLLKNKTVSEKLY